MPATTEASTASAFNLGPMAFHREIWLPLQRHEEKYGGSKREDKSVAWEGSVQGEDIDNLKLPPGVRGA